MIDTNVLVSAVYNPDSKPAYAIRDVCENHELLLCDQIVAECYDVVRRKFPQHTQVLDKLLTSLGYSLVVTPHGDNAPIADPKDAPILNAAILEGVDMIISGDSHFLDLDLEWPKVLTLRSILKLLMVNARKCPVTIAITGLFWLRGEDLNLWPLGYEPNELPDCSTPRYSLFIGKHYFNIAAHERQYLFSGF